MRAEKIRRRLTEGPCTWAELAAVSGYSEHRCQIEVAQLRKDPGCTIDLKRTTLVTLVYDPEIPMPRVCAWPDCTERLRLHNGTGYCGVHTQTEARRRWLALSPVKRRQLAEELCEDESGAAVAPLFDEQFCFEDCGAEP